MKTFNVRKWLNGKKLASTGSVVAYSGPPPWKGDKKMAVLEVADCHGKIRLHQSDKESTQHFIRKLKRLRNVIDDFIAFLEKNN